MTAIPPVAATPDRLRELSVEVGRPIYWLGPRENRTYELTRTPHDRIFVRYLPKGVAVGHAAGEVHDRRHVSRRRRATSVLKELAKTGGESSFTAPKNGFAVYSTSHPTNVYLAYPGSNVQIEVFDPSAEHARELITSGQVVPVG